MFMKKWKKENCLISDIDGTLLKNEKIDDIVLKKIEKLQKEIYFGLSTGRALKSTLSFIKEYNIKYDFISILNGAIIYNNNMEKIHCVNIEKQIVDGLISILNKYQNLKLYICNEDKEYQYEEYEINHYEKVYAINVCLENFDEDSIIQLIRYLHDQYGANVEIFRNENYLDIISKGCSKGLSAKIIMEKYKIKGKLFCIGDSYNDIPMLLLSKYSGSFNKSNDIVKKSAKYIVENMRDYISIVEDCLYDNK